MDHSLDYKTWVYIIMDDKIVELSFTFTVAAHTHAINATEALSMFWYYRSGIYVIYG